jgi:nucleoside 2-deoxyribosyltransferase
MKRVRVCIYGGTDLEGKPTEFISALAYEILNSMPAVIVTGGFKYSHKKEKAVSTDVAALKGATKFADERGVDLKDCYEAWIPEPSLDRRDLDGVVRLTAAEGITVRVMTGRTALGRRLAMVAGVDIVVTISGKRHTEIVAEQALELGLPILPIPNIGGDSEKLLENYRQRIADGFAPGALEQCLKEVSKSIGTHPQVAASAVVDLIRTAKIGRCLVLLPYDDQHNFLYTSSIEPTVAKHMIPVRLDRLPRSEAIYTSFADAIRSSAAVIADITLLNENVMYEVGYAHGYGLKPLIYTRDAARLDQLPVYFRTLNVRLASEATPINVLIDDYLGSFMATRRIHQTTA